MFTLLEWLGRKFSTDVVDTAKVLCRDLVTQKPVRGDSKHVFAACALYLATKMHGHGIGRSKKEIAAEFRALGVTERGLTSTAKMFKDVLHLTPYAAQLFSGLDAGDLINRCVDRLDVDDPTRKSIKRVAHQLAGQVAAEDVEGKTPCGICSGVVNCALAADSSTPRSATSSEHESAVVHEMNRSLSNPRLCGHRMRGHGRSMASQSPRVGGGPSTTGSRTRVTTGPRMRAEPRPRGRVAPSR
jgi:hypothetical protein